MTITLSFELPSASQLQKSSWSMCLLWELQATDIIIIIIIIITIIIVVYRVLIN